MHTNTRPVADDSAVARFGTAFADACMKATVAVAQRSGWTAQRLSGEADRFCAVIREEAVAELKWVMDPSRDVLAMVESGRVHAGYLDLTIKAAVAVVASRSLARMEAI